MKDILKHKEDLKALLQYVIKEYSTNSLVFQDEVSGIETTKTFGTLYADYKIDNSIKKNVHLRKYQIRIFNEKYFEIIIGDASILYADRFLEFRNNLLSNEHIKSIIMLDKNLFECDVIPTALIIISYECGDTLLASVTNLEQLIELLCGSTNIDCKTFYINNLVPNSFKPSYYDIENKVKYSIENNIKELKDVAMVISGKASNEEDYSKHGIPYIRSRDIKDGNILKTEKFISHSKVKKYSKQLLQEGDILLTKFFGQNKLAIVTNDDIPAIASNMLFVIRPYDVPESYLYEYLTSETGKEELNKQLNKIQKGTTITSITLKDLIQIKIPILDNYIMQTIGHLDTASKEEVEELKKELKRSLEQKV